MSYTKFYLKEQFCIKALYSLHYFEFAKDFVFEGEKHNFWEFLYVDKGEAEVMADTKGLNLKQGDIIFHKPDEFHSVWANQVIAPNLVVISFECLSSEMKLFEEKLFSLNDTERNIMAMIIKEGKEAFISPLNLPKENALIEKPDSNPGCQQLIKLYLELLLLNLCRKGNNTNHSARLSSTAKERSENEMVTRLTAYMQENIHRNLTINQLCLFSKMGKTHLMSMFRERTYISIMVYFKVLKIDHVKKLIREGDNNFTEISDMMGYSSIHCLTRAFKKATGMTLSEYAKSIISRS